MSSDKMHDTKTHDPEKEAQHIEAVPSSASQSLDNSLDFQLETLSYGKSGLAGILGSGYVFAAAGLASMGGFSFGYGAPLATLLSLPCLLIPLQDQGVVSIILTMTQFHDQYPETRPGSSGYGFHVGFMTGMLELGAFLGCLIFPKFADVYSRKWGLTAAVAVFCLGAIIQTASQNYGALVAGRTIGGVGVGTLAMGAPLYISEVAPPNLRGSLLVLEAISIVVGAIVSYWITYATRLV
jgi:MFS family permease